MAILRDLKERNSEVYCPHYAYLLDVLEWKLEVGEWRREYAELAKSLRSSKGVDIG